MQKVDESILAKVVTNFENRKMITRFCASDFTIFSKLEVKFSPKINIFIGENGTGKTHLMKAVYAACCLINKKIEMSFDKKINSVFTPNSIGRLVRRSVGRGSGSISVYRQDEGEANERSISLALTTLNKATVKQKAWQIDKDVEAVFVPVKDMLANAPGFRSLFSQKKLSYEEVYLDVIDKAFLPLPKGKPAPERKKLLDILNKAMSGKVIAKEETFYIKNRNGELEFPLLAEGFRKLGLIYRLIQNETLTHGSMLFWDEPEANLNPKLSKVVVEILLELSRMGVQIFVATHDYVLLKEFDLAANEEDEVLYHALYRNNYGELQHQSTTDIGKLEQNSIDDTFSRILDDEIQKGLAEL